MNANNFILFSQTHTHSDVDLIGNLLDDLGDDLPVDLLPGDYDPPSLANDSSGLLNSNVTPQLNQQSTLPNSQQNVLNATSQQPQTSQAIPPIASGNSSNQLAGTGNSLTTSQSGFNSTSNATGSGAANATTTQPGQQHPQVGGAAPPTAQVNSSGASPNPNAINMYPNTNSMPNNRFAGLNASGAGAPSPQPTSISTSGDPTPTLPSVSSSPAHNIAMSSSWNQQRSFSPASNASSLAMSMSGAMTATTQSSMNPLVSTMTGPSPQMMTAQRMGPQHAMGMQPGGMGPMRVSHPQAPAMGMQQTHNTMMRVNPSVMGHPSMGMTAHGHVGMGRPNMMQPSNMHGRMGISQAHYMQSYNAMHPMQQHQLRGHMNPAMRAGQPTMAGGMHHMNPHLPPSHPMRSQMVSPSMQSQMMHRAQMVGGGGYGQNSMMGQPPHATMLTASQPQMQTAGPPTQQVQHVSLMQQQQQMSPQQQQHLQQLRAQQQQQQQQQPPQQVNPASISPIPAQQQQQQQHAAMSAPTPPLGGPQQQQQQTPPQQQLQQQQQQVGRSDLGGGGVGGSGAFGGGQSQPPQQQQSMPQQQQQQQAVGGAQGASGATATTQQTSVSSVGGSGQPQMPGELGDRQIMYLHHSTICY